MLRRLSYLTALAITACALRADEPAVLTSISRIRPMSLQEAQSGRPVRIEGVVTYRRFDGRACFVQDEGGGICCMAHGSLVISAAPGHRVRVEGQTQTGGYAPGVRADRVIDLGPASLPEPAVVTLAQIVAGRFDSQYVEVHGVVRAARLHPTGQWTIDIASERHRVTATIENGSQADPTTWVDGVVRMRGVAGVNCNRRGQLVSAALRVFGMDDVVVERPPPADPFSAPAQSIQNIMKYSLEPIEDRRVKVTGVVLHQQSDGSLYVQDETGGVRANCRLSPAVTVGDRVEVLGFPEWGEYSPRLEDASFRRLTSGPPPAPVTLTVERLLEGRYDAQLVQLEARLVAQTRNAEEHLLMLKSENVLIPTRLARSSGELKELRTGSLLKVTGICGAQLKDRQFRSGQTPVPTCELVLRTSQDVVVVRAAPWWNLQRALWLAAGISALLLVAVAWGILLRRRVNRQTAIIGNRLQAQAAAEERARVARELHDTVEQDLAAVAMHLSVIQNHGAPLTAVAHENLQAAFQQVRRSQKDAHCAVWDLRSVTLSEQGLPAALEEVLSLAVSGRAVASQCEVQGEERRLSSVVEHHLLRMAQEAITNAVRHAEPQEISVTLAYDFHSIALRVRDDGCGFEVPATPHATQRFGLLGMHERAARIGATLSIQSEPREGTVVEITLPASPSLVSSPAR